MMKSELLELLKEYEEDLKSGDCELIEDAMTDIIAEMYCIHGECEELDAIFKGIGWIDENGMTIFENAHRYVELMK